MILHHNLVFLFHVHAFIYYHNKILFKQVFALHILCYYLVPHMVLVFLSKSCEAYNPQNLEDSIHQLLNPLAAGAHITIMG